jgi:hypothetical protein
MKRSHQVAAPLLAAAALALTTGCRKPEMQRCVDEHNQVVDDSLCANQPNQQQRPSDGHGGFIPFIVPYHYYYGGYGGYGLGTPVGGGTYLPNPSSSYTTRSGVTTRGGFGRTFSDSGAHGSSGGDSSGS